MPKIYLDEIDAVLGSGTCSSLSTDSQESKTTKDALTSYISESKSTLKGEQWDKSRAKMEVFSEALQTRIALAEELMEAIKKALTLLKDYLGEDSMLDTEQLPEYQKQREICVSSIDKLNAMLTETHQVPHTGSDGKTYYTTEPVYDSATIQAQIDQAKQVLAELDRIIKKIEGLEAVYNQALAILEEAFAGLQPFQGQVTSITPSGIFTYKPASTSTTSTTSTTTTTTTTDTSSTTDKKSDTTTTTTTTTDTSATDKKTDTTSTTTDSTDKTDTTTDKK